MNRCEKCDNPLVKRPKWRLVKYPNLCKRCATIKGLKKPRKIKSRHFEFEFTKALEKYKNYGQES